MDGRADRQGDHQGDRHAARSGPSARRGRWVCRLLLAGGAVLLLPMAALGTAYLLIGQDSAKYRIEAAVHAALGHELRVAGPLGLAFDPWPLLRAGDVTLANPDPVSPAGSAWPDPWLLHADAVEARIAFWPLLRGHLAVQRLHILHPEVRLARNAAGEANWIFRRLSRPALSQAASPQAAPGAAPGVGVPHPPHLPDIRALRISGASVTYRNARQDGGWLAEKVDLAAAAADPLGTTEYRLSAMVAGVPVRSIGLAGSLAALLDPDEHRSWPVHIGLVTPVNPEEARDPADPHLSIDGVIDRPRHGRGYHLMISLAVEDGRRLSPLLRAVAPGWFEAPEEGPGKKGAALAMLRTGIAGLREATLTFRADDGAADGGTAEDSQDNTREGARARPVISAVRLHAGNSLLGRWARLQGLEAEWPGAEAALRLSASGIYRGTEVNAAGQLGQIQAAIGSLLAGKTADDAPMPVKLTLHSARSTVDVLGDVAPYGDWSGTSLTLSAFLPDMMRLSALTRTALPAAAPVSLHGRLRAEAGGWRLDDAVLTSAMGDVSGAASWTPGWTPGGRRPVIGASLRSGRLDLDALRQPAQAPPPPKPEGEPDAGGLAQAAALQSPVAPGAGSSAAADPPAAAGAMRGAAHSAGRPSWLTGWDGQIDWRIGTLRAGGMDWTDATLGVSAAAGGVHVEPLRLAAPGQRGPVTGRFDLGEDGTVSAALDAGALPLEAISALLDRPGLARGDLGVDLSLRGHGLTPQALTGLDGHASLWTVGGTMNGAVLDPLLAMLAKQSGLPLRPHLGAETGVACFAVRADAVRGVAALRAFALDTDLLRLAMAGYVDMRDQTLFLFARPLLRTGGAGLLLPAVAQGGFAHPSIKLRSADAAAMTAALDASLAALGEGALAAPVQAGIAALGRMDGGDCAPALAVARGAHPGPAPVPSNGGKGKVSMQDLLKGLLR